MPPLAPWSKADLFSFVAAPLVVSFVLLVRRHRRAPLLVAAAIVLLVAVVALASPDFDLVGWHGLMHGAPLRRLFDGGPLPPEDPLFAGATLRYPWVQHLVMVWIGRATGIAPIVVWVAVEIVALGVLLVAVAALARLATDDGESVAIATLLGGFGVSIFHEGVLQDALLRAFPSLSLETRVVPLDKFANPNAMPVGYAAALVAAVAALQVADGRMPLRRGMLVVAAATLVAVLFHPLSWLGLLLWLGVVAAALLLDTRDATRSVDRQRALGLLAAVALPSLASLPYLHAIGASGSSDGWSGLTSDWPLFVAKLGDLAIFAAPLLLLVYVERRRFAGLLHEDRRTLRLLFALIATAALAYLALRLPGRNEYKFLLFASPAVAVVLAVALRALLSRHAVLAVGLLLLLVLPGARALGSRPWFHVHDACHLDGPLLRANDAAADELYRWIETSTPWDAVFVAADLRLPPLTGRSLYIAVDAPWRGRDGWGLTRTQLLQWHVRQPDAVMYRRQHLATLLLDANFAREAPEQVLAQVAADLPGRSIWVHETSAGAAARLDRTPGFTLRFRNPAGSVYSAGG